MTTLEHETPEKITDYWTAALKFRGTGRTSRALRAMAANEELTRGVAEMCGTTVDEEREQVLGIADAIDVLESHRLTPEDCYNLAGLDKVFGVPYAEFDPDANWYSAPEPQPVPAPRASSDAPAAAQDTPDCPRAGDGGSHSISWHQGGTCAFCGASARGTLSAA